jgi:geranylgeranyl diphosphate synthase type II
VDLEKYLAERAELVNTALKDLLVREDEYPKALHSAVHYSLFAGGKRLRPILTLAAAEAVGGATAIKDALNTACAMECIHTYSLIHDDLPALDDDDVRRGRPTCHKEFGEAMAILAGDALLTAAFGLIGRTESVRPEKLLRVICEVAHAAGSTGMIGGQVVDIESEGGAVPFPVLEYIHIHKTGEMIMAAVKCGGILGGAAERDLDNLTRYARAIGLAFQITDDILDVVGASALMGKTAGADESRGKVTYPSHIGLDESKERAAELVAIGIEALAGFDESADPLREIASFVISRKG